MEPAIFETVRIVMTSTARSANVAKDKPIAIPLRITGIPVALLFIWRNPADAIDVVLRIALANYKCEIFH